MNGDSALKNGVFAFMDALGFKGIWQRANPGAVIAKFDRLLSHVARLNRRALGLDGIQVHTQVMLLSDTVIIACSSAAKDDRFGQEASLVEQTASLVAVVGMAANVAAGMVAADPPPIACRGAIAVGPYYLNPDLNLVLGPAVDEAAENEKRADGALIWLSEELDQLLKGHVAAALLGRGLTNSVLRKLVEGIPLVRDYPVPMKDGDPLVTSVVNPFGAKYSDSNDNLRLLFERARVREGFIRAFEGAKACEVVRKAQRTVAFLDVADSASSDRNDAPLQED